MVVAPPVEEAEFEADASDPELEGSNLVGVPLVERMLGGTVIDEYGDEGRS